MENSVEILYNKLERKHKSLLQKEQVLANIICKFLDKKRNRNSYRR